VIRGIQESNDRRVQIVKNLGIRAVACHPLLAGDRLLGTLSFASRTRDEFGVEELGFFGAVARAVALSYERSRLARELAAVEGELDALGASAEGASIAQFETAPEVAEVVSLAGAEGVPAVAEDAQLAEREAQVEEVLLAPPEGAIEDVQSAPREDEPAEAPSAAVESPIELIEATPVGAEVILFARYAAAVAAAADVPLGLIEAAPVSALEVSPLTDVAHDDAAHEETVESEITVELCALDVNTVRVPTAETPAPDLSANEISALDLRPVETVEAPVHETKPRAAAPEPVRVDDEAPTVEVKALAIQQLEAERAPTDDGDDITFTYVPPT
jgi:hypothetical protein